MIRGLLFGTALPRERWVDTVMAGLRVFTGLAMALGHGVGKIPPSLPFVEGVRALGFPAPLVFAWSAAGAEFLGGLFLAVGFLTRPSALSIIVTMSVAGFLRHAADPFAKKEMAFLYLALATVFLIHGGGRLALDRFFRIR